MNASRLRLLVIGKNTKNKKKKKKKKQWSESELANQIDVQIEEKEFAIEKKKFYRC